MELIRIEKESPILNESKAKEIYELEKARLELGKVIDELKKDLLEEMEIKGIKKIENDYFILTYVPETDRETFDTKTFKKDNLDLYDEYVKISKVKSSVRLKVKEREEKDKLEAIKEIAN